MRQTSTTLRVLAPFAAALLLSGAPALAAGNMDSWSAQDRTRAGSPAVDATSTAANPANDIAASDVHDPQRTLTNAGVQDQRGHAIGYVRHVTLDRFGRVEMITVALRQAGGTIDLMPANFYYDRGNHNVVTRQSRARILSFASNNWSSRAHASLSGWTKVSRLSHPSAKIFGDDVRDASGAIIGEVSSIETDAHGMAQEVNVTLDAQSKVARLAAADLRYSPASRTLDSILSSTQIDALAG